MKRQAGFFTFMALFFLAGTIPVFAQDRPSNDQSSNDQQSKDQPGKHNFELPSDILGPQLIAWSLLQRPHPVPEPAHPPQSQEPQEGSPPAQQHEHATQTFTGTIGKDGSRYVLKVSDNTAYQLDDQERARQYEGKPVRVDGTLNPKDNSLHILNLELIS